MFRKIIVLPHFVPDVTLWSWDNPGAYRYTCTGSPSIKNVIYHLSFYLLWVRQWSKMPSFHIFRVNLVEIPVVHTQVRTSPKVCVALGKMGDQRLKLVTRCM